METIYKYEANLINNKRISLSEFKDKVLLIVNTASKCGFAPQLAGLEKLHNKYKDEGFSVLAFPSDDFMKQEFSNNYEIEQFCSLKYSITFPLFAKIHVRGANKHPLFEYLSNKKLNSSNNFAPIWNYQKYLINREGRLVNVFLPFVNPLSNKVQSKIIDCLKK